MRRSICYTEPAICLAGEISTWKFIYTPSINLPKGTKFRFDILSKGREIDWMAPSAKLGDGANVIYLLMPNKKILAGKEVDIKGQMVPSYDFVLPLPVKTGEEITVVLGAPKLGSKETKSKGSQAQKNTQRRRPFHLYVDTTGKGKFDDPEIFTVDVKGNTLQTIRLLTPSFVAKNKRFDITLRFEDEYGNLTSNAPPDTLVELSYENIRENLNWKLFVPETGFINLPNLYFNEEGIYTIRLYNPKSKQVFRSSPIKCFPETSKHLFWGSLHGESERYDSTENIDNCLRYFRDDKALNFYGVSPFEDLEETPNDVWKSIAQTASEFNEDDRFTTFHGMQWAGAPHKEGVRQIVYLKESKQIPRKKDGKSSTLAKLYSSAAPKEFISIPCFTMAKGFENNFSQWDPNFERVVEIYNSWGSSECPSKDGNPAPIDSSSKKGIRESSEGSIQEALNRNCRFGFVAGGLDDRGIYAGLYEGGQTQYPPGLTAIIAAEHNRTSLGEALYQRSCYATTGERILLGLYLAGNGMGKELSTVEKPGLLFNRHLMGFVAGTANLVKIEIIRNGEVIQTFEPEEGYAFEFTYDDMDPLEKITLKPKDKKPPFAYYYLRVTQEDGHMAWSSPIWVDYVPVKLTRTVAKKPPAKGSAKASFAEAEEEEEDDLDEELLD
jgi:hypothetical protein